MTCESCGQQALKLRHVQFNNGAVEAVCRRCVEAWAREFGGQAAEVLKQWDKEMP